MFREAMKEQTHDRGNQHTGGKSNNVTDAETITEKPVRGWGEDPKKVEAVIKDDPECLAMFRAAMNGTLAESRRPTKEEQEINLGGTKVNAEDVAGTNAYWQARNTEHGGDHKSEQARQVQGGATTLIEYGTNAYW